MTEQGYYRFPTINSNQVIFVSEDDLWSVSDTGGVARRLTAGVGECSFPRLSPDGSLVAFVAREEGHPEVYVMSAQGGSARRLTFLGSEVCLVAGFSPDGRKILFVSDARSPFLRHTELYEISAEGGLPVPLSLGHGLAVAIDSRGAIAVGRNSLDPARWKRYRGGTAGEIYVAASAAGKFKKLPDLGSNLTSPMWLGGRLYFLSDHEGTANIYSCRKDGGDIKRHSHHREYYVRFPSTDGRRIVYTAGAQIYILDPASGKNTLLNVETSTSPTQAVRKFVKAADYLEHFDLHPDGHCLALIARGQPFTLPNWEEGVIQHGAGSRTRYRLCQWLPDGKRFVVVTDASRFERVELHCSDQSRPPEPLSKSDIGRVTELAPAPDGRWLAIANHRHQLLLLSLEKKTLKQIDRAPADRISGLAWSPDGRWLAYSRSDFPNTSIICLADTKNNAVHEITRPLRQDFSPCFDPEGKYLYFLSTRDFIPVYDAQQFDLSFPRAQRPFLVTLRADVPSPFVATPRPFVSGKSTTDDTMGEQMKGAGADKLVAEKATGKTSKRKKIEPARDSDSNTSFSVDIDFSGISDRILSFPVDEGRYEQIVAARGRVLFTHFAMKPMRRDHSWYEDDRETGNLVAYDFDEQRAATIQQGVGKIRMGGDNRTLLYRNKDRLRVLDALSKLPENSPPQPGSEPGRKTGWIDLGRVTVMIEPRHEWEQMFHETWRLQREHFWDESMSQVDWDLVFERYSPLLARVGARSELSDLIWEMQGELGTSHAYEMGGDYRRPRSYYRGFLGAELSFDRKANGYRIERILRGDSWDPEADSPLAQPGLNVKEGDIIVAVGGRATARDCSPDELLVNSAGRNVTLTLLDVGGGTRRVTVKTIWDERLLRYRRWVEDNRKLVHAATGGRIGYLHIPDMGPWGFAEFHRGYLSEINCHGLIVDVRYNRGGHVSPLLLEKLARKRVGYDVSRWGIPQPYPPESVAGPMVAITNQFAGSDGDIFSHCFKLYKLGPLVGKRTWGGVIGIWPRHRLVDGTITTQPEFSFWFSDVGWKVENYGTDPDYEVDFAPHDYRAGRDPQMEKALLLITGSLKKQPFILPQFDGRPALPLPASARKPVGRNVKNNGQAAKRKITLKKR